MSDAPRTQARRAWAEEAIRRANGSEETPEDRILGALLSRDRARIEAAARLRAATELLDSDYLAYWVDELGLRDEWRFVE